VIDPSARVHATADLEPNVRVGSGTSIWHRAQLRTGVTVGADCVIGRDVFIDEGVLIGDRVKIQNAALVYHGVTVEDGVFIGPGAILTNDRYPRAITSTGDLARADDWTVSPITLREGCSIGAGAIVIAGVDVGRFATIGAGAVVTRTVTNYALVAGNPARRIGWVCACGARLVDANGEPAPAQPERYAAHTELTCGSCGRTYAYVPDAESLEERTGPRQGAPA
jgi:UDP-2-acetamido-3-amino-2,3-dideoxy-glucuronate N-acetyltransferase